MNERCLIVTSNHDKRLAGIKSGPATSRSRYAEILRERVGKEWTHYTAAVSMNVVVRTKCELRDDDVDMEDLKLSTARGGGHGGGRS